MKSINTDNYSIHFNQECYTQLNQFLKNQSFSVVFILVDVNTHEHCLPYFLSQLELNVPLEIIEIEAGEHHKNIETCLGVWNAMSELGADRKSLLLNLGGGVITDLGGFVASTFKRGIKYINIPTSLLAMVDASVGGKTGIDLGTLKNQIGVINSGEMVLIDTSFLDTLPQNHMKSGFAEMLKHGLIMDLTYWNKLTDLESLSINDLDILIYESIDIKKSIVEKDPLENSLRKTLNFGHTLGHAIESYFLGHAEKQDLLHGESIAIGMILECYLSSELLNFPKEDLIAVKESFLNTFKHVKIEDEDYAPIIELMKHDKKNENGNVYFVLLEAIGKPKINCTVSNDLILKAFEFYSK